MLDELREVDPLEDEEVDFSKSTAMIGSFKRDTAPEAQADEPATTFTESAKHALQAREQSSAVERCGPHVALSPAMLRSSNRP